MPFESFRCYCSVFNLSMLQISKNGTFANNLLLQYYNCHVSYACGNEWSHVISQFPFQTLFCLHSLPFVQKIFCTQSKNMTAYMYLSRWIMQQRTVPYFLINKITYILKMSTFLRVNLEVCSIYTELFSFWSISLI